MSAELDIVELLGEADLRRCVENRVAAENEQHFDLARLHLAGQLGKRLELILGPRLDRFGPAYGAALGAQRPIHRLGQGVNDRRLLVAGIDDR